jgi:predicted component of viral defense system (DUF524 family)
VVHAVITPSGPEQWTIYEKPGDRELKPGDRELGIIVQDGNIFTIHAYRDNILTGVSLGPYPLMEDVRVAIAAKIGGSCSVGA